MMMAAKVMLARSLRLKSLVIYRFGSNRKLLQAAKVGGIAPRVWRSDEVVSLDEDNDDFKEDTESKRHISRLPESLRTRMKHSMQAPPSETADSYIYNPQIRHPVDYRRQSYAKFGQASGIDPGWMWPSKQELAELEAEEKMEPTLQEMLDIVAANREEEENRRKLKQQEVEAQMAKMPEYIKKYQLRLQKQQEETEQMENKRKLMQLEAREYFGYNIDRKDPRYVAMQERKEEEAKKDRKKRKKAARAAQLAGLADLPSQDTSTGQSQTKPNKS